MGVSFGLNVDLPLGDRNSKLHSSVSERPLFGSSLHTCYIFLSAFELFLYLSACAEYGGGIGSQAVPSRFP